MGEKTCPDCNTTKARDRFSLNRSKSDGLQSICRDCQKIRSSTPHRRSQCKEASAKWRSINPDIARERVKRCQDNNPEKYKDRGKRWAAKNPDKAKLINKRWRDRNIEKVRAANRIRVKRWESNNPEKHRLICYRKRHGDYAEVMMKLRDFKRAIKASEKEKVNG